MTISMIFAMDRNRVIGIDNKLPWRLPADMAYFRKATMGHTVLMGRKTYESIGKPLDGRRNVIVTTNRDFQAEGCLVVHSVEEAMSLADGDENEVFVIGGAEIYRLVLPFADRLHVTEIDHEFAGDAFFPEIDDRIWEPVSVEQGVTDEKNPYSYRFVVYERRGRGK